MIFYLDFIEQQHLRIENLIIIAETVRYTYRNVRNVHKVVLV